MEGKEKALRGIFGDGWFDAMRPTLMSEGFDKLGHFLMEERKNKVIYPEHEHVFRAFKETSFETLKVVFLGLDPYINKGQALGRSFGIDMNQTNGKIPPSLRVIHKELESDLDCLSINFDYTLEGWANQGVLMLNTALTVEHKATGSHLHHWDPFLKGVIDAVNAKDDRVIFILLGKKAQGYRQFLNPDATFTIEAPHPAAEAYAGGKAGFYGSRIFSKCNSMLYMLTKEEIDWNIKDKES